MTTRKQYTPKQLAKFQAERKQKLSQAHDRLVSAVEQIVTGEDWLNWLKVSARFHSYSFNNVLLIATQRPDATRVAGFTTWQSLGRQVRKGEKGIQILAPSTFKKTEVDDDGNEHEYTALRGFRIVSVFDISQTDGDPLPEPPKAELLQGDGMEVVWSKLAEMVTAAGYALERGHCGGANGFTDPLRRIVRVRDDVSGAQALKTLIHEVAHIAMKHTEGTAYSCRGYCEVEAESVAFLVCDAIGIESDSYSFGYVAGWSGGSADTVRESGAAVVKMAHEITELLS